MHSSSPRTLTVTAAAVLAVAGLVSGCEKTTTTTETPAGTATTTTVTPTPATNSSMSDAGHAVADGAITAKVKTALLADADVKGLKVDVDTKGGIVTLSGALDSTANVDKAVSIAKGIDGVTSVDNRLTVGTSTASATGSAMAGADKTMSKAGEVLEDSAITAKVKTALLADPDVKGLKVNVDTKDGIVTLVGTLDNSANVEKAAGIAKGIDGVKSVDNKLMAK
ncbi:MAG: BON domain-containing protein [Caldimonas sp.]